MPPAQKKSVEAMPPSLLMRPEMCCPMRLSSTMIVAAGSAPPGERAADRNIMDVAGQEGVYCPSEHLERARAAIDRIGGDPEAFVRSHVRRLEALRRVGHAERIDAGLVASIHAGRPAEVLDKGRAACRGDAPAQ